MRTGEHYAHRISPLCLGTLRRGAALVVLLMLCGCVDKGFLAQQEMGRGGVKLDPLVVKIIWTLPGEPPSEPDFSRAVDLQAEDMVPDTSDYVIGKTDLLNVSITELVGPGIETVKQPRVTESGYISLPYLSSVRAAGLTEAQLEQEIIKEYKDRNIIQNAQVSVSTIEQRQRVFEIRGNVARAGQYQILQNNFKLMSALILAGDVTTTTTEFMYILRPSAEETGAATQPSTLPAEATGGTLPATEPIDVLQEPHTSADPAPGQKSVRPLGDGSGPIQLASADPGDADIMAEPATEPATAPTTARTSVPAGTASLAPVSAARGYEHVASAPAGPRPSATTNSQPFEFESPLPQSTTKIIRVPLEALLTGNLQYNCIVRPHDTLVIPLPVAGEYYLGGHIARAGVYTLTGRQITLKQAIISAGGLDDFAWPYETDITRRIDDNTEINIRLDMSKVFEGSQPDIYLKPYDVVTVGTNLLATFLAATRNGYRISYGFGFIYDKNYGTVAP